MELAIRRMTAWIVKLLRYSFLKWTIYRLLCNLRKHGEGSRESRFVFPKITKWLTRDRNVSGRTEITVRFSFSRMTKVSLDSASRIACSTLPWSQGRAYEAANYSILFVWKKKFSSRLVSFSLQIIGSKYYNKFAYRRMDWMEIEINMNFRRKVLHSEDRLCRKYF